jgi:hypothetical protein
VTLVVRDHGPRQADIVADQIRTFGLQPHLHRRADLGALPALT